MSDLPASPEDTELLLNPGEFAVLQDVGMLPDNSNLKEWWNDTSSFNEVESTRSTTVGQGDHQGGFAPAPPVTLTTADTDQQVLPHAAPVQPAGDQSVRSAVNSAIPELDSWPGQHRFHVTVRTPPAAQHGRQQPYVFDAEAHKLYVDMNIPVTFSFRVAEGTDTSRLLVSALPVYPDMQHVNTPVRRCPTHRLPELECNAGADGHIDHVIRAEHDNAVYQEGGTTKERRSVVVPFERLQPGTEEYKVLYKFCCMNTCVGGINRRRLMVLFTLEDARTSAPLGRQTIEVKVCKCPHRDARTDQIRRCPSKVPRQPKRPSAASSDAEEPAARRRRTVGQLVIEVEDIDEYDHLKAVLESYRAVQRRRRERSTTPSTPPAVTAKADGSDGRTALPPGVPLATIKVEML